MDLASNVVACAWLDLQLAKLSVMDLYARHVNGVVDDKTAVSDTKPKVSDEELEKEFGRQRR